VRRNWLVGLLCLVAIFGLIRGVTAGALWDPHELSFAELSRRIALNLLGGSQLAIPGADNSLPIRADLGRGELPFTSAALGFRCFGLSEWSGRAPLVAWALLGLGALYAGASRLWQRRTALYAVVITATTPLFFLQARTLLGDAVTIATFTMAWSGFATAVLAPALGARARVGFALVGVLGAYAGFWCRGPVVNVAVPTLAVGLAACLVPAPDRLARALGFALLPLGALALGLGVHAVSLAQQTHEYSVFVGSALLSAEARGAPPSFDTALGQLAHAAFPWSAFAPLALAVPWRSEGETSPARAGAAAALLGLALALAASAWLAPALGSRLPPALCCFAALVAAGLHELEMRPRALPSMGLACAALAVMLGFDLHTYPEKVLAGFGLEGLSLPESLEPWSGKLWQWSAVVLASCVALWLYERDEAEKSLFRPSEYREVLTKLQELWDGNLVFAALVLEAGLVGFLLLSAISERLVHLEQLDSFGLLTRRLVAVAAVLVPLSALLPLAAMLARDASRLVFGRTAATRSQGVLCVAAVIGLVGSLGFYPTLARQVAPKQVFERYRELGRAGEPLGMVGEASVSARYQAGTAAEQLDSLDSAFDWLAGGGISAPRRWLLVRATDLPELSSRYRARYHRNLPILDARSSELLLASNRRLPGERDESPLSGLVLDAAPTPQHSLRAVLGNKLEVLGWSVLSRDGQPRARVTPGTPYRLVIYYRVLAPLSGAWKTFVHVDGLQRRFNADHTLLQDEYPPAYWRAGDWIADGTELLLEPNFSPGKYQLYFGMYAASRRLEVTEGPSADDRIVAGTLEIE
jgi:hypothetical protein